MPRREGQLLVEDYFFNNKGLNTADSPFLVDPGHCTGGQNFDFQIPGAIQKRKGHSKLNSSANAQLKTLGLGLWDRTGGTRKVLRAAGRKLQDFNVSSYAFTNLSEDTASAGTDFLAADTTQPVVTAMFNRSTAGVLWAAGGGMSSIYGMYSGTKATKNGVETPAGSLSVADGASGSAGTLNTGTYYYAVAYYKASTGAISNAVLDASVTVTATKNKAVLDLSGITGEDVTKYTKLYIYRSSVGGSSSFTAGTLVTTLDISGGIPASFEDTGSTAFTGYASSQVVPRANNTLHDNSTLPSGTYKTLAVFKRRLVTASSNTIYFSDLNKDESWSGYQYLTLPTGGDVTGLTTLTLATEGDTTIEEVLLVFQLNNVWIVTGDGTLDSNNIPDWTLKYLYDSGVYNQAVIVQARGHVFWVNPLGVWVYSGSGKPRRISDKIKDQFAPSGSINKGEFGAAWGMYCGTRDEVQWVLSSKTYGTQKFVLRLDVTETLRQGQDGVFNQDVLPWAAYAGLAFIPASSSTEQLFYYGDAAGYIYSGYVASTDSTASSSSYVSLEYLTPYVGLGLPGVSKRAVKVVAWVLDRGDYNLELEYWSDFRNSTADASARSVAISPSGRDELPVYGSATYGTTYQYGAISTQIRPVVFNLADHNAEGDYFRFRFAQRNSDKRCVLYGFSVYFQEIATRK